MNGSYSLLPLRSQIQQGLLPQWPDAALAVLFVLTAHENPLLKAWPSQNRIAMLAGISKTSVGKGLDFLHAQGWLNIEIRRTGTSAHFVYNMRYAHYMKGVRATASYIAVSNALIMSGAWARMTPSARRLYLVLRSRAYSGPVAGNEPVEGAAIPAHEVSMREFATLAGLEARTCRKARAWLSAHGFLQMAARKRYFLPTCPQDISCETIPSINADDGAVPQRTTAIIEPAQGIAVEKMASMNTAQDMAAPEAALTELASGLQCTAPRQMPAKTALWIPPSSSSGLWMPKIGHQRTANGLARTGTMPSIIEEKRQPAAHGSLANSVKQATQSTMPMKTDSVAQMPTSQEGGNAHSLKEKPIKPAERPRYLFHSRRTKTVEAPSYSKAFPVEKYEDAHHYRLLVQQRFAERNG